MQNYTDKAREAQSRAVGNQQSPGKSEGHPTFQFVDNRPESHAQRRLQAIASNGQHQVFLRKVTSIGRPTIQRITDEQKLILTGFREGLKSSAAHALKALSKSKTMEDFRTVVHQLSPSEVNKLTQSARTKNGLIRKDVQPYIEWFGEVRNELIAANAEALAGKLNWVTSGASNANGRVVPKSTGKGKTETGETVSNLTNAFTTWLGRGGSIPQNDSNMNCWEACLYSGFKAGVLHPLILYNIYEIAKEAGQEKLDSGKGGSAVIAAYANAVAAVLGAGEDTWTTGQGAIPRGHLVFFDGPSHVAVSRGTLDKDKTPAVMSLWYLPGPKPHMQATSVGKILSAANSDYTITYGPAPL